MAMAVVIPGQFRNRDVEKFGDHGAASPVYARRRFAVLLTLAIIVLVLQRMLGKRLSGRGRFALWAIVLVRLLLPVMPQSRFSVYNLTHREATVVRSGMDTYLSWPLARDL